MGCDFPIPAYRGAEFLPSGKRPLVFNPKNALNSTHVIEIPCNRCMGCRLEKARQWAVRMLHESKLHDRNCFITLTYDNDHVPTDFGLDLRHWQLFMKKLRKSLPHRIRFFACGEYGDLNYRPHYHAIIFNHDFSDKKLHSKNKQNLPIYTSSTLTNLWSMGHATTQDVTYKSAAYVARYVTKKAGGSAADKYFRYSPVDGKRYEVRPEFAVMSRGGQDDGSGFPTGGIGSGYVRKFKSDFFPSGFVVVDGHKVGIPQFYKKQLTEEEREHLKRQNMPAVRAQKPERNNARRYVKATVRDRRIKTLKREL